MLASWGAASVSRRAVDMPVDARGEVSCSGPVLSAFVSRAFHNITLLRAKPPKGGGAESLGLRRPCRYASRAASDRLTSRLTAFFVVHQYLWTVMPFKFKLSRRLAVSRSGRCVPPVVAVARATAGEEQTARPGIARAHSAATPPLQSLKNVHDQVPPRRTRAHWLSITCTAE